MTTIVAVQRKGDVEFAADSQMTYGNLKSPDSFRKVFANGPVVFGFAGSVRAANVLRFMDVPALPKKRLNRNDLERWVVTDLVPAMQDALETGNAMEIHNNEVDSYSRVLVSVQGSVYEIGSNFSVTRESSGVYSVGSGSDFALGAMAAGASPAEAVKIASKLDSYTGGRIQSVMASGLVK